MIVAFPMHVSMCHRKHVDMRISLPFVSLSIICSDRLSFSWFPSPPLLLIPVLFVFHSTRRISVCVSVCGAVWPIQVNWNWEFLPFFNTIYNIKVDAHHGNTFKSSYGVETNGSHFFPLRTNTFLLFYYFLFSQLNSLISI